MSSRIKGSQPRFRQYIEGENDLYPHLFRLVGTCTLGTLVNLAASAVPVLPVDARASNPAIADNIPIRAVSTKGEASTRNAEHMDGSAATQAPGGLQRLEELNLLSAALVEKAGLGSTPAHEFRIEARMYRELLRQTMLNNRAQSTSDQLPQHLLLDMVRMSALLHSAADCKTGFVITCPADLMLQLKSQQSRVTQGLKMIQMMRE